MKKLFALISILFLVCSLYAVDSYIIPIDSELYTLVDTLYRAEGLAIPATSRPWSKAQADKIVEYANSLGIDEVNSSLYESILNVLDSEDMKWSFPDGFGFSAELNINPEFYYHTNTEEFISEENWAYDFNDRSKFLDFNLGFSLDDYFYTYCDLLYSVARYGEGGTVFYTPEEIKAGIGAIIPAGSYTENIIKENTRYSESFSLNMPSHSGFFDFCWPKRAFVSFGNEKVNLIIGRERIEWGNSNVGNFIFDKHVEYHDLARLSLYSDFFSYEWTNLFLDSNYYGSEEDDLGYSIYMAHRLDFRILRNLTFTISENVMYKAQTLDFGNLNPGNIYHNLNKRHIFNAIAHAELNYSPIKGMLLYGQFCLDQATAPNESDSQSPSIAYLAGIEYSHKAGKGHLTANAEYVYTSPLLYRRDEVDFLTFHKDNVFEAWDAIRLYYIGFPYGGDVNLIHFGIDYDIPETLYLSFTAEFMNKGEMTLLKPHNASGDNNDYAYLEDNKSPSGDIVNRYTTLTLSGEYKLPQLLSFMDASVTGNISYVKAVEEVKQSKEIRSSKDDVQLSMGLKLCF